jgi:CBS domain-containing protein
MNVREIMTPSPASATPDTNLRDVSRMMLENDCGAIPVTEGGTRGRPLGIVTDRDIVVRCVAQGKNPLEARAADVMSGPAVTVDSDEDVDDAAKLMGGKQVRRLVVLDEGGMVCGIVSQADIAMNAAKREIAKLVQEVSQPVGTR